MNQPKENSHSYIMTSKKPSKTSSETKAKIAIGDYQLSDRDTFLVGDAEIDKNGLVDHHISSTNRFYEHGIEQIIVHGFEVKANIFNERQHTPEDKEISDIKIEVKFTKAKVGHPTMQNYYTGQEEPLMPNTALLNEKTYSANVYIDAHITATANMRDPKSAPKVREADIVGHPICRMPIMVKSSLCNDRRSEGIGGYFIVKGVEWVIDSVESMIFNKIRIYKNEGFNKEVYRCEFISKPGDSYENQGYLKTVWYKDGQITFTVVKNYLKNVELPFYVLFRFLGCTSDKEMFEHILYEYDTKISTNMFNYVREGLNAAYTHMKGCKAIFALQLIVEKIIDELKVDSMKKFDFEKNPDAYQFATGIINQEIDTNLLPHIGKTPSHRFMKMRFLGHIIRKIFLTKLGIIEPSDRDSFMEKRVHAAGPGYAKPFKTSFNAAIVQAIIRKYTKDFRASTFSQVDLKTSFKTAIHKSEFERLLVQSITSGNKAELVLGLQRKITNRLFTQLLVRKNQLATLSSLRQISVATSDTTRQSERAQEMRRVHNTFLGYICLVHSPVGEKVGINKQMAMFASISQASSSIALKSLLEEDKDVVPLKNVKPYDIYANNLSNVFVNGDWVGCTMDADKLVCKYRTFKRHNKINKYTSIHWDNIQDDVYFWTDFGRMLRPLIVVYNNQRDRDSINVIESKSSGSGKTFTQGIGLTSEHIEKLRSKQLTIDNLTDSGLVEYVSPEEQVNYYICPSFEQLSIDRHNELKEYTHLEIPQSTLGMTALSSPISDKDNTYRLIYQTNQVNQTCGLFSPDWPFRCDKDTFLQYRSEVPMVRTVINKYTASNGNNAMVMIACYTANNQEDSTIMSKGASERGLFNGCKMVYYKTELEQNEEFRNPSISDTSDIKANANYSKLVNGVPNVGSTISKGDAIIGKLMLIGKNEKSSKFKYIDKSLIYKENENAIVQSVICGRNEDEQEFVKIQLRKIRPVSIGDKFCIRENAQIFTENGWISLQDYTTDIRVLTMDAKTGKQYYTTPFGKYMFEYDTYNVNRTGMCDQKLLHFMSYIQSCSSIVTPQHTMFMFNLDTGEFESPSAEELWYNIGDGKRYAFVPKDLEELKKLIEANVSFEIRLSEVGYIGNVGCIEVPDTHIFLYREVYTTISNNTIYDSPIWTGNSSKHGNKGIVSIMISDSDAPRTADGIIPAFIINPACIPSRMAIGQMMESMVGTYAAAKGAIVDGTIFNNLDTDTVADELEKLGYNRHGYQRVFSGITGEPIDTPIFMGSTFYQRLQKFVADNVYSVCNAATDAITYQPLSGKSSGGGLRSGEMELWALNSAGVSRFLYEKTHTHSDGYVQYICRCGKPGIYNAQKGIYKCKECGDNADLNAVPTSWSSKLFMQELDAAGVGVRRFLQPFTYDYIE